MTYWLLHQDMDEYSGRVLWAADDPKSESSRRQKTGRWNASGLYFRALAMFNHRKGGKLVNSL